MNKHYKWYVYELINPIDGKTFYIGKGSGARVNAHEKEALKGVCSEKCNKIRDIWSLGFEIKKRKNAMFWDEQAAYDHETDLIAEIGLQNLTNVLPGGQVAFDRRYDERQSRKPIKAMHDWIQETPASSAFFDRFAEWFKAGLHNGGEIKATALHPAFTLHASMTEAAYNKIIPMFWRIIKADKQALDCFIQKMNHHQVEICHGCS